MYVSSVSRSAPPLSSNNHAGVEDVHQLLQIDPAKVEQLTTPDRRICKRRDCLVNHLVRQTADERAADEPLAALLAAQHLGDAVLLGEEHLLADLVQEVRLAVPAREREPGVVDLDDDERVLVGGTGGEDRIRVELARCAFDAVAVVLEQLGRGE
jgi:hypothetical protein